MNENIRYIIILPIILIFIIFIGEYITTAPFVILSLIASLLVGLITFQNPEKGLLILIFSMMLSPEISVANVPGRQVTVRVDDILILVAFTAWLARTGID
jgi:hypothetical protein